MSQDVNFATAGTSVFVAESQVFAPERSSLDELMNRLLVNGVNGMGLRSVKLTSRTPSITAPEMVIKTLTALNVMGALTPRSAQNVANKMMQLEIPAFPEKGQEGYEEWMDSPIQLSLRSSEPENTHDEQSVKDNKIKDTEEEGDVSPSRPKNGEQ
jgi:capsid portal protein